VKTFTHQLSSDIDFLWQSTTLSCYLKPSYVFKVNSVYCSLLCRLKYNNLLSLQDLEIFSLIWNAFSILTLHFNTFALAKCSDCVDCSRNSIPDHMLVISWNDEIEIPYLIVFRSDRNLRCTNIYG
jgi:hypothetical protein